MISLLFVLSFFTFSGSTFLSKYPGHFQALPPDSFKLPKVPFLDGLIVGGQQVDITSYPWQLSLQYNGQHICGASIISSTYSVTAAHCVVGMSVASLRFRAGSSNYGSGGSLHPAAGGVAHGSYNSNNFDYDIAVVYVSTAFSLGTSGIKAVTLPSTGSTPTIGVTAYVSGWGVTSAGSTTIPEQLRAVDVPIVSQSSCRSSYGNSAITDRMVCAGYTGGGKDACQGDSGGPLVINGVLVGIVSWGQGCAAAGYPGVYSNVGNLRSWISQQAGV